MTRFVALFRGVNVGGTQVRMDELKALHEELGLTDVTTYIRSGNVLFSGDEARAQELPGLIEEHFAARFGFPTRVILRTAAELDAVIAQNPFTDQAASAPNHLMALLLKEQPAEDALTSLRQSYHGPEEYLLGERVLYIFYSNGIGNSKLTLPIIEKRLKTTGTGRNWNTILQLQRML